MKNDQSLPLVAFSLVKGIKNSDGSDRSYTE